MNLRKLITTFLVPSLVTVCALVVCGFGIGRVAETLKSFQYNQTEISKNDEDLGISVKMDVPEGITNIALFGVDSRDEAFTGLSDSIMIVTVDAVHNDIKVTSIQRDTLVKIGGNYQKINAAYNIGGAQLAIKTLNQSFGMNIRHYATVDFVSMADIIDTVGGVEVEVTEGEVKQANAQIWDMYVTRGTVYDTIDAPGKQVLNGVQAVAFARIRKTPTVNGTYDDAGRTERQRLVMRLLFEKALKMSVNKYPAMIKAMLPCMETNLTYAEIFELAGILTSGGVTMKEARLPADRALISYNLRVKGLGSCKYYNLDYAGKMLNAFVFEDVEFEDYMDEHGVDRTEWFFGELEDAADPEEGEEELPEEGEETPGEGEETPGEGEETPGEGEETPGEGEETPGEGEATPGEGEETPPTDGEGNGEGETPPAEEGTPPAEEEKPGKKPGNDSEDVWFPGKDDKNEGTNTDSQETKT
ncbi:MAG: LCP family protein [Clostridia bacterium]|nr:LCP family protein [Clostridia bacterium]